MVETRQNGAAPTALLQTLSQGPLTRAEVKSQIGLDWRQTTNAARSLLRRGYLHVGGDGRFMLSEAGLIAVQAGEVIRGGPKGQVKIIPDSFRQRAWRAMKVRRVFTIGEVVADAACGDEGRPRDNAARYINRLAQAGYVKELPRRSPGTAAGSNGFKQFRLIRNSGPKAPVFRTGPCVMHDPNTREDVPCKPR